MLLAQFILAIIILGSVGLLAVLLFFVNCILSAGTSQDFVEKGGGWVIFFAVVTFIMSSIAIAIFCLITKWR
ncbi:hypothetical protein LCGC14_3014470 [marine sediment metagenome]|uniref:Uncharacterized protein n=1 Tax=marine sediment metagenome TaxID=412755 RepID=A0A0F8WXQ8_9ZZZZ